jgi:alpha-N-arabinofuranosidase
MNSSTLHLHTSFTVDQVDPRVFGGFLEHLGRAVYEGVYEPSSAHADEFGCRRDVLEALRRLRFTAMRYPGGNFVSGYHWEDGVGPKDRRPVMRDLAWQSLETNQFGTDEFCTLCTRMGWTPMMAVNLGTGTPEEARNWLEYCNIEAGSKYAEMRRANGFETPHGVKLWCLGNEMDGSWQIGHVPAEAYAIRAQQTANMMRMCDPSVELVLCGTCGPGLPHYMEWDRVVLEHCHGYVDFLSVHSYATKEGDTEDFLAFSNSVDRQIEETSAICHVVQARKRSKKRVQISFDEWNVWTKTRASSDMDGRGKVAPHLIEEVYNLEDALVVAGYLNSFIRHADTVKIANLAQIVNVIAPILTRGDDMVLQSIFYPIEMIARRGEGVSLTPVVSGAAYESPTHGATNRLDASAILNGDALSVFLVNRSASEPLEVTIDLSGASISGLKDAEIVTGADPLAANSFEAKDVVVSRPFGEFAMTGGRAVGKLPPLSVVAATFSLG